MLFNGLCLVGKSPDERYFSICEKEDNPYLRHGSVASFTVDRQYFKGYFDDGLKRW
jgi:hypothetical protein